MRVKNPPAARTSARAGKSPAWLSALDLLGQGFAVFDKDLRLIVCNAHFGSLRAIPDGWELTVADRGRTLPAELRQNAFVPFTPQRARGSGLGLAVVARIAREHRGLARIDEHPGGGNLITVTFGA